ncbi:unnamed protein product [Polarella glacialis]|uniref:Uncharacterized protein n=1 Tax=Polarella glacialis TaxID=89957 RepID=A0A813DH22_POLGL|nr:unnamed protein product [Polarella glacialis]
MAGDSEVSGASPRCTRLSLQACLSDLVSTIANLEKASWPQAGQAATPEAMTCGEHPEAPQSQEPAVQLVAPPVAVVAPPVAEAQQQQQQQQEQQRQQQQQLQPAAPPSAEPPRSPEVQQPQVLLAPQLAGRSSTEARPMQQKLQELLPQVPTSSNPRPVPPPLPLAQAGLLEATRASAISEAKLFGADGSLYVRLLKADGLPEHALLSLKVNGTRRQASVDELLGARSSAAPLLRLPLGLLQEGDSYEQRQQLAFERKSVAIPSSSSAGLPTLGLTVLRPVASANLVLHPLRSCYRLEIGLGLGGPPLVLDLRVRGHGQTSGDPSSEAAKPVLPPQKDKGALSGFPLENNNDNNKNNNNNIENDKAALVQGFLAEHRLMQYVQALLQAAIRERAPDPFSFMASQLRALKEASGEPQDEKSSDASLEAGPELQLVSVSGPWPEGSLLSVRSGGDRRQALVRSLLDQQLKMKISKSLLLQVSVLVPEAAVKLALSPDKEVYRTKLKSRSGQAMLLALRVRDSLGQEEQMATESRSHVPSDIGEAALHQQEYLARFGLLDFAKELMHELAEKRPEEPLLEGIGCCYCCCRCCCR